MAVAAYYTLCALYLADLEPMYMFMAFASGDRKITAETMPIAAKAFDHMMLFNWGVNIVFWVVLWSVKFTLLLLFRKLLKDTGKWLYWCWWAVAFFTFCMFWGCFGSQFRSCDSIGQFRELGKKSQDSSK